MIDYIVDFKEAEKMLANDDGFDLSNDLTFTVYVKDNGEYFVESYGDSLWEVVTWVNCHSDRLSDSDIYIGFQYNV